MLLLLQRGFKLKKRQNRIALTISDEENAILEEISNLTGRPKTKLITEVLRDIMPMYKEMLVSLKEIRDTKEALPVLARWTAYANSQVALMNHEMADFYSKEGKSD